MHEDNDEDDAEESAFAPKRCKKRSNTFLDSETADSISSLEGSVYGFHESKASKKVIKATALEDLPTTARSKRSTAGSLPSRFRDSVTVSRDDATMNAIGSLKRKSRPSKSAAKG